MSFPRFFIDRPIFAIVLSVLMMIGGIVAFFHLPLSEYPAVTPPTVQVTASYPGANPQVIAETVAAPLEQVITGVEGMLYMTSQSATDGRMILTATFAQGTNADMAQIQVQNRVSRALPRLPGTPAGRGRRMPPSSCIRPCCAGGSSRWKAARRWPNCMSTSLRTRLRPSAIPGRRC